MCTVKELGVVCPLLRVRLLGCENGCHIAAGGHFLALGRDKDRKKLGQVMDNDECTL